MSPENIAIIGSGVLASCVALNLTRRNIPHHWYRGHSRNASNAAGAMLTAVSEWDFYLHPDKELENVRIRLEGQKLMASLIAHLGITYTSKQILVYDNEENDLSKILDFSSGLKQSDIVKAYSNGTATLNEPSIDAREFLSSVERYCAKSNASNVFYSNIQSVSDNSSFVTLKAECGELFSFAKVVICTGSSQNLTGTYRVDQSYDLLGLAVLTSTPPPNANASRQLNTMMGCGLHELPMRSGDVYLGSTSTLLPTNEISPTNITLSLSHLQKEMRKSHIKYNKYQNTSILSGVRSITGSRVPSINFSATQNVIDAYGLGRTGFSTAPYIAKVICDDLSNDTKLSETIFEKNNGAPESSQIAIKNYSGSNCIVDRTLKLMSRSIPIPEVIAWSEATNSDT